MRVNHSSGELVMKYNVTGFRKIYNEMMELSKQE